MAVLAVVSVACIAAAQIPPKTFKHIIIVIQENRTPDNLFGGAPQKGSCTGEDPFEPGVDIANGGYTINNGQRIQICDIQQPMNTGPIFDPGHFYLAGNLYGNIGPGNYFGIGAIGELSPGTNGWTYSDLANFNPTVGYSPLAPPVFDAQGNLYGTTRDGGITQPKCWTAFGCGVIFKMTPTSDGSWTYDILHHFASHATDGQTPTSGLLMDNSGILYGATGLGGVYNQGTVFKFALTNGRWKKTVLYDFPNCSIGCYPGGAMAFDKAGNLYGIADGGIVGHGCGGYTCGVVFRLAPLQNGCWKYNVMHRFIGSDGAFPLGVVIDDRGHLFGTTQAGGTYNAGVAFEITQ